MKPYFRKLTLIYLLLVGLAHISLAVAGPNTIQPSAMKQIHVLKQIKASRSKVQTKLESRLYMATLRERRSPKVQALPDFRYITAEADGLVAVDIALVSAAGAKSVMNSLEKLGAKIVDMNYRYKTIRARVRINDLESIAALDAVRKVRQAIPAFTHKVNASEGDQTHGANTARGFFGTLGTGVKVCVLSDGVDSLASLQASGDLPPVVDVLPGQAGSGNEGSAMLEIIHDLAPGADLGFATANPTEAQFAQNILDLATDGCNIIVDDIIYLDESPFQDGPVAQAVNTVTASGVIYFSAAGNEGNLDDLTSGTWEGDFLASAAADPGPLAGANLHDFGDGGNSILVEFGGGNPPLLIWAENYDLASGNASTDFDLYVMNGALSTIFDASTDVQDGVGGDDFPIEFVGGGTFSGERLLIDKFAAGTTSSVPMMNLIVFRGELDDNLATSGSTRGHSAAADAFSVAATPAANSFDGITLDGPFPGLFTAVNVSESFSSDGPRRVILSPTGVELCPGDRTSTCAADLRQDPDITAADGVSTAAPGFSTFYGTSASATHAAAIAALIKSALPAITPANVRSALTSSAIDIESAGVDRDTGAGIVMAQGALQAAGATAQAFLDDGTPVFTEFAGDGDAFIEPNEEWSLTVPLQNIGGVAATAVAAALSTPTANVTLLNANSGYPDLAPSVSANNAMNYVFRVGPGFTCGGKIDFMLTATYTGGSNSPQNFNFTSDATGADGTPVAFSYTGSAVPIPDAADLSGNNPGAPAQASVSSPSIVGTIKDVDLSIDGTACSTTAGSTTVGINHTFVNDLEIKLIAPSTTSVLVINNTDGSGNNFCQTVLDDESGGANIQSVVTANAPFTGSFKPNAALSAFDTQDPNGAWILQAQDFFSQDTGNIRAFTVTVTPAVCDAPPLGVSLSATKTVSGTFAPGGTITYSVVLTNSGTGTALDNAGDELTDVLPAGLTLVSANASSGTAIPAGNTVTWNGSLAPAGSTTITIVATINAGTGGNVIGNQASFAFDADFDGTNESSGTSDDPSVAGANDPTNFTVGITSVSATKTVSGTFTPGQQVTYTIGLSNTGNTATLDNAGDEFTDVLPAGLTLVGASAGSGTAATAGNTVTWNGSIASLGSVTITIVATIDAGTGGTTISNQGSFVYDADLNGSNESQGFTDDPGVAGAADPTNFVVGSAGVSATKTVSGTFTPGQQVTYTIGLSNSGNTAAPDNPGDEFTDMLPAGLTLVGASAGSGTAMTAGTTVTWNGSIASLGSVTITIVATIDAGTGGTTISNQGSFAYDADLNGTNESTGLTDDPGVAGATDPTDFVVQHANVIATMTVNGNFAVGEQITYTAVLTNNGNAPAPDNPGDEFTNVLPAGLTLIGASATGGTVVTSSVTNAKQKSVTSAAILAAGDTVTWNGGIAAGGSVTITINATINAGASGTISNQATVQFDADLNGSNETQVVTDDPGVGGNVDPTSFTVQATISPPSTIPALSPFGLVLMILTFMAGIFLMNRRISGKM